MTEPPITTLEDTWVFANNWWLSDPTRLSAAFDAVMSAMRSRGGYHSVSHIERMLAKYRQWCGVVSAAPDPRLVSWIFAHDLVYMPGAPDNEQESATQMDRLLAEIGGRRRIERDDRTAIESTKSHLPVDPAQLDEPGLADTIHLLHDLDMEILGSSIQEYETYRAAVYAEYLAASADPSAFHPLWLQGRKAFLESMLQRDRIFKTPVFETFEQHARDNMRDELGKILAERGE